MATPSTANLYLGAGEIWFNRFDSSGNKTQWRHLGNCSKFELDPNVNTVEKYSSMSGARGLLSRAVVQTGASVSLTLNEFDPENVALAFLGATTVAGLQTTGTATDLTTAPAIVKKGSALDTGKRKIVVTSAKKSPSTALTSGTDYTYDSDSGLITILPGATNITDGDTLLWTGTYPTITTPIVQALSNALLLGALRFRSATDAVGPRYVVDVWRASMQPDGAIGFIGNDYAEIGFKAACLQDTSQAAGNQFFQAQQL
jgi:hypothetical protein